MSLKNDYTHVKANHPINGKIVVMELGKGGVVTEHGEAMVRAYAPPTDQSSGFWADIPLSTVFDFTYRSGSK